MAVYGLIFLSPPNRDSILKRHYKEAKKEKYPKFMIAETPTHISIYQLGDTFCMRDVARTASKQCKCKVLGFEFGIAQNQTRYFELYGSDSGKYGVSYTAGLCFNDMENIDQLINYVGINYDLDFWQSTKILPMVVKIENDTGLFFGRLSELAMEQYFTRHGFKLVDEQPMLSRWSNIGSSFD